MIPQSPAAPQLSCDTLVAVAGDGSSERRLFAKNSDRPWTEAQPLEQVPAAEHAPGSTVRCQSLTIPQADRTLAVLGSRPWWLWGFEQGLNEAGVAIGNEAIYTREESPCVGLLGMDLVRLGLERGDSAASAKRVITEHIERYGQGGSSVYRGDARYFNSFIVADADEAYVIETSGHHWVSKRITGPVAIANLVTIGDDWDECSSGIEHHARRHGLWTAPANRRLDFRRAFEDRTMRHKTQARYQASCNFLAGDGTFGLADMMRHLRDHFESGTVHLRDVDAGEERPRSVCLHPERWDAGTTASMVIDLTATREGEPEAWCSMGTPCTSAFIPIRVGETLPPPLRIGAGQHDERSLWWRMHELANETMESPGEFTPIIQRVLLPWEKELLERTASGRPALPDIVDQLLVRQAEAIARLPVQAAG